jgi:hypothetical protein
MLHNRRALSADTQLHYPQITQIFAQLASQVPGTNGTVLKACGKRLRESC